MKKMMIIAGSLLVAAFVNAATVNWGVEAPANDSGSGRYYVFALGTSFSGSFDNGGFDISLLTLTSTGGAAFTQVGADFEIDSSTSYWYPGEASVVWSTAVGVASATMNQWWAVVLVDDSSPGYYGVDVFQVSGMTEFSGAYNTYPENFDVAAFTTVPEPTSMALLALGAAALGLRRRSRR